MKLNLRDEIRVSVFSKLIWLTILLLVMSCSTIVYRSKGRVPITFDKNNKHRREVILKGSKDFYLWGLVPNRHYVYIDELAQEADLKELSRVEVYEQMTTKDSIFSFLSLGLYSPASFQVEAMTISK
jgi:hypothetical protein